MLFPLKFRPTLSYHESPRSFGCSRPHSRKHAGCDLVAPTGAPILAVEDGIVLRVASFYEEVWVVEVEHADFVVRYGEVSRNIPKGVAENRRVKRGQIIAHVGYMARLKLSMLHFEMYDNTATGALSDRSRAGFQRRKDLIDPTDHLDRALVLAGDVGMSSKLNLGSGWASVG